MKLGQLRLFVRNGAFALVAMLPVVAGCGETSKASDQSREEQQTETQGKKTRYLPFSIRFDLKGNPVIVDEKGNAVPAEPVELPVKATSIAGVQSISVITYTGSCKQVFSIGGKLYAITLPDSYCASL